MKLHLYIFSLCLLLGITNLSYSQTKIENQDVLNCFNDYKKFTKEKNYDSTKTLLTQESFNYYNGLTELCLHADSLELAKCPDKEKFLVIFYRHMIDREILKDMKKNDLIEYSFNNGLFGSYHDQVTIDSIQIKNDTATGLLSGFGMIPQNELYFQIRKDKCYYNLESGIKWAVLFTEPFTANNQYSENKDIVYYISYISGKIVSKDIWKPLANKKVDYKIHKWAKYSID